MKDFIVNNYGSMSLIVPLTQKATKWLNKFTNAEWFNDCAAIDNRYINDIVEAMKADKLKQLLA